MYSPDPLIEKNLLFFLQFVMNNQVTIWCDLKIISFNFLDCEWG